MSNFLCITSVGHIRSEPSHKSEMLSQLLFGEFAEGLETSKDFTKIKCLYDGYEGWCQSSQLVEIDVIKVFHSNSYTSVSGQFALLNETTILLSLATPLYHELSFGKYHINYGIDNQPKSFSTLTGASLLSHLALSYLNTPYLWGGKSSFGIDCSGFTQQVFKMLGIFLKRDAYEQAMQGKPVDFLSNAVCGDLAFFENEVGHITHVGILLSDKKIIHASGYVKIDSIDKHGIVNGITGVRTHKLKMINRYL